jgi:hypothetical protein
MSILKTIEFWLFALTALIIAAALIAVVHKLPFAGQIFLFLAIAWMVLAIVWMFKEIVRRVRG